MTIDRIIDIFDQAVSRHSSSDEASDILEDIVSCISGIGGVDDVDDAISQLDERYPDIMADVRYEFGIDDLVEGASLVDMAQ